MARSDAVDAISARVTALEMLPFAVADTHPDRARLRGAFEIYAAGIEAKMNALPVADRQLELSRQSLADMPATIA